MYIDYKATIWFRISLRGEEEKVIEALKNGKSVNELYDEFDDFLVGCDPMFDTEEILTPEENNGQSTIEIYKDTELIYSNAKE
jgi:hypothetical protein